MFRFHLGILNHMQYKREVLFFDETSSNITKIKNYVRQPIDAPLIIKISSNPEKKITVMGAIKSQREFCITPSFKKTTTENLINFWKAMNSRID
jgi:hypothetical protein